MEMPLTRLWTLASVGKDRACHQVVGRRRQRELINIWLAANIRQPVYVFICLVITMAT